MGRKSNILMTSRLSLAKQNMSDEEVVHGDLLCLSQSTKALSIC